MNAYEKFAKSLPSKTREILDSRKSRLFSGNFGNCRKIRSCNEKRGWNLNEAVVDYGQGYRIYWSRVRGRVEVLTAGFKKTQKKDIAEARKIMLAKGF